MRKVSTALTTIGLATTAVVGLGYTPAAANPACPSYPPGSTYAVNIGPGSTTVGAGARVTFAGWTHRGTTNCVGHTMVIQYAKPGKSFVNYRVVTTNSTGRAYMVMTVPDAYDTFRWVWYPTPHTVVVSKQVRLTVG